MVTLSMVLYFLSHHPLMALPVIFLVFAMVGAFLSSRTRQPAWLSLIIVGFLAGMANIFTGHFLDALFLKDTGVPGSAVIVHTRQTNSTMNDQYISEYDVVLRTADGRDVTAKISDMTAPIYPIRNEILIPPQGERFAVKYTPGYERNFVILSDQSQYGKERLIQMDLEPVQEAESQLAASPMNQSFQEEYRAAAQHFLGQHRNDADPQEILSIEQKLRTLDHP